MIENFPEASNGELRLILIQYACVCNGVPLFDVLGPGEVMKLRQLHARYERAIQKMQNQAVELN